MATFEEIAPTIAGLGVTETQANNYLDNAPEPPPANPDPEITLQKAKAVADAFYVTGIEAAGGIHKLAQTVKLKIHQVKTIIREIEAWKAEREANE